MDEQRLPTETNQPSQPPTETNQPNQQQQRTYEDYGAPNPANSDPKQLRETPYPHN